VVSKGERAANGLPRSDSVIANGVEAVIGAVYVDGGFSAAEAVVYKGWRQRLEHALAQPVADAKTALQEWSQQHGMGLPVYHCEDAGVGRSPRFHAVCELAGQRCGSGRGERKKDAEQQAATVAMQQLRKREDRDG